MCWKMDKLEIIMISKTNQSQKNKYPVYTFIGRTWILKVALNRRETIWKEKRDQWEVEMKQDNNN